MLASEIAAPDLWWWIPASVVVALPVIGIALHLRRVGTERRIFSEGVAIAATVTDVRIDEGDCVVTYAFTDEPTGRTFSRSGVLGFQMKQPPVRGDTVAVRYLRENPAWSRMADEIHLSSR